MNQPIRIFVADDEYQGRQVILKMLDLYFPDTLVAGQAETIEEAVAGIQASNPSILFLDIRMNGKTGFEVLDRLDQVNFHVIFTTAYQQYAVKAFRYSALDYLVKPINPEEFKAAVQKGIDRLAQAADAWAAQNAGDRAVQAGVAAEEVSTARRFKDKIGIPTTEGLLFVASQEIIFCQAQSNYTELHLSGGRKITSSYTLKAFEDLLSDQSFFRTHKSFLINLAHIDFYRKGEGGVVVMSDGREIEVARRNKAGFLNLFKG